MELHALTKNSLNESNLKDATTSCRCHGEEPSVHLQELLPHCEPIKAKRTWRKGEGAVEWKRRERIN